jgi:hypothetical protein
MCVNSELCPWWNLIDWIIAISHIYSCLEEKVLSKSVYVAAKCMVRLVVIHLRRSESFSTGAECAMNLLVIVTFTPTINRSDLIILTNLFELNSRDVDLT